MANVPVALIEAVNSALQEGKSLTWRIHGGEDKIMMNIMWTRTSVKKSLTVRPVKPLTVASSSTDSKSDDSFSIKDPSTVSVPKEGRRQLPPIPSPDTQLAMASEIKQRQNAMPKSGGSNGHGQLFTEYKLMAEYNLLMSHKVPGCYAIPSALTPLIWHGVLFIRQGMYQEGVFRFILTIPENFPDGDCPSLVFSFPVFHPLVDLTTGELDVKRAFPKWRKSTNHIWQVLLYARRIFYKIDTKLPWNKEAASLYDNEPDAFRKEVLKTVNTSKEKIEEPVKSDDPHILRFTPLDPSVHEEVRKQMMSMQVSQSDPGGVKPGLSWMKPGSVQIFTREDSALA
ncbi:AKT-interacting protein-like isoform X2 [Saccostrea cucullata]|uniref:AKT-interacting protein-like isoform X2 n=1 Tax=Saccostrea cuccullata TaxID=36930 RepID=UPI002ED05B86